MSDPGSAGEKLGPWTRLSSRPIYENPWIRLREDQVLRPDGSPGIYGVLHYHNRAVCAVPIDAQGRVILVGQYRYPLGIYSWEIPEGGCPEGEDLFAAVQRELREETGCTAARWDFLGTVALSNSTSDEMAWLWLARDLTDGQPDPDATEILALRKAGWEEAWRLAMEGEAVDSLTVIGLARAKHFLDRERSGPAA